MLPEVAKKSSPRRAGAKLPAARDRVAPTADRDATAADQCGYVLIKK